MPNEGAFAIHNKQQKRESFTFPLSADLTFILTRLAFPLKRSREGTGDKGEVREGERGRERVKDPRHWRTKDPHFHLKKPHL